MNALVPLIDRLKRARHEPGDRSRDEDTALAARAHLPSDELNQIHRTRDVRVDHVPDLVERLIEKRTPQPVPRVGEERVDGTPRGCSKEPIHAFLGRQVGFDRNHLDAEVLEGGRRHVDVRRIGGNGQVVSFLRADQGQLVADPRRGACHERELPVHVVS